MTNLSLMDCTGEQTLKLKRDHFERGDFCILSDGYSVWLSEQKIGETPKQSFTIPKSVFDFLIRKYMKPQAEALEQQEVSSDGA